MTSGGSVRLRFLDDGDGSGKLVARAKANGFAGEGGAYFSTHRLEQFAASLEEFPLNGRRSIAGGFYDRSGALEQELLSLVAYQIDAQGHIGVRVRLSTELWPSTRAESQHSVALEIRTTYERLRQFSHAILQLIHGHAEEAVLEGDEFPT